MRMTTTCAASTKKGTAWGRKWSNHLMTKTLHLWFLRDLRDLLRPHNNRTKKKNTSMARSNCYTGTRGFKGLARASEQRRPRFWAKEQKSEALRNIISNLSDERNLKDLHSETQPCVHRAVPEEDHSLGYSWKNLWLVINTWWKHVHSAI